MKQLEDTMRMLNLMSDPAFCVRDGVIEGVNQAAKPYMVAEQTDVFSLLLTGKEEYSNFTDGCLHLTLSIFGCALGAAVTRIDGVDIFLLEQEEENLELKAMALAARDLKEPLSNVMTVADRLFSQLEDIENPFIQEQAARINRGLFQLLRTVCNMSDASRYAASTLGQQVTEDIAGFLDEVLEKAAQLLQAAGYVFHYTGLKTPVCCLMDKEMLERAIYNLLANAAKFTPRGGTIEVRAVQHGAKLHITVRDNGTGIPPDIRDSMYSRFLRSPGLDDGRWGIGLGLMIIRTAAAFHGGTVLVEHPREGGTAVTMTMTLRQKDDAIVRSPIPYVDYAGGRDHSLVELSRNLPIQPYEIKKIN